MSAGVHASAILRVGKQRCGVWPIGSPSRIDGTPVNQVDPGQCENDAVEVLVFLNPRMMGGGGLPICAACLRTEFDQGALALGVVPDGRSYIKDDGPHQGTRP